MSDRLLSRSDLRTDTLYVFPDGGAAWTPDGVGVFWFDTEDEAREQSIDTFARRVQCEGIADY